MSIRYPIVFGGIGGAIIAGLTLLIFFSGLGAHIESPLLGYLVMLLGLTLTFVGIKRYRDIECGGVIRFLPALALGIAIGLVAALIYVAAFELYVATAGAGLVLMIDQALPGYAANTIYRMSITFLEIFPPVLIVAFVSAAILRDPRVLPARNGNIRGR